MSARSRSHEHDRDRPEHARVDDRHRQFVDRVARDREVVLLANRGVGASTRVVPDNVPDMARDVLRFADALGLEQADLLGFSLGGFVAQELALRRPRLVRRLVLAGAAPEGGPDLHRWSDDVYASACADEITAEHALNVFFSDSEQSRAKGMEYLERTQRRQADRDAPTDLAARDAQLAAITAWGIPDASKLNRLAGIVQPTFVAVGDHDTMMHTKNRPAARRSAPERPPPRVSRRQSRLPQPGTRSCSPTTSTRFSTG